MKFVSENIGESVLNIESKIPPSLVLRGFPSFKEKISPSLKKSKIDESSSKAKKIKLKMLCSPTRQADRKPAPGTAKAGAAISLRLGAFFGREAGMTNYCREKFNCERKLINDLSDQLEVCPSLWNAEKNHILGRPLKFIVKTLLILPTFPIFHPALLAFRALVSFAILTAFYLLTWELFDSANKLFRTATLILLLLELCVNLNTTYFEAGVHVTARKGIVLRYLKTNFLFDAMSSMPVLCPLQPVSLGSITWNALFFFKLVSLRSSQNLLEQAAFLLDDKLVQLLPLVKIIFKGFWITHLLAFAWMKIDEFESENGRTSWMSDVALERHQIAQRYLYAIYLLVGRFASLGGARRLPNTATEEILGIVTMVIYQIFTAFFFAKVMEYSKAQPPESLQKEDKNIKSVIRNSKYLKWATKIKILKQLEYTRTFQEAKTLENNLRLTDRLSGSLREELLIETKARFLKNCKLLSSSFSPETLRKMLPLMLPRRFSANEIIIKTGERDNANLIIVAEGLIELYLETNKRGVHTQLNILKEGDHFSEQQFFLKSEASYSAKSLGPSLVFFIKCDDFLKLLSNDANEFEKFCFIRDKKALYSHVREESETPAGMAKSQPEARMHQPDLTSFEFLIQTSRSQILQQYLKDRQVAAKNFVRKPRKKLSPFLKINQNAPNELPVLESLSDSNFQFEDVEFHSKGESKSDSSSSVAIVFKSQSVDQRRLVEENYSFTDRGEREDVVEPPRSDRKRSIYETSIERELEDMFPKKESYFEKSSSIRASKMMEEAQIAFQKKEIVKQAEKPQIKQFPQRNVFETMKEYAYYFPHNNASSVIGRLKSKKQTLLSTNFQSNSKAISSKALDGSSKLALPSLKNHSKKALSIQEEGVKGWPKSLKNMLISKLSHL